MSESRIQQAYIEACRLHPIARRAFAVPNGGARNKITAAILKAEGVLAGVPDVLLLEPRGKFHGLAIEFKDTSGRLTPEQRDMLQHLVEVGYCCAVAYDAELAWQFTVRYLRGELEPSGAPAVLKVSRR